jgi:nucleotide-binding universal stress UspA family protein
MSESGFDRERRVSSSTDRIVIGVNFTPECDAAFAAALDRAADQPRAELHPVFVQRLRGLLGRPRELRSPLPGRPSRVKIPRAAWFEMATAMTQQSHERLRVYCDSRVEHQLSGTSERTLPPLRLHVELGDPANEIVRLACELAATVVVVGTRKRGRLSRWLLGSVSQRVVRAASCPVLVVPEQQTGRFVPAG